MNNAGRMATGAVLLAMLILVSCGGSDSTPTPGRSTLDAAVETAEQAGVSNSTREYASQMCKPLENMVKEMAEVAFLFEDGEEESSDDIGAALVAMEALLDPLKQFVDDLKDISPPKELQEYHRAFLAQMTFAVQGIDLISEGGIFAAAALGDGPPTPEEPPDLEDAITIECGEELLGLMEQEDLLELFGDHDDDENGESREVLRQVNIGEEFTVEAEVLGELFGEGPLTGTITVLVRGTETPSSIESGLYGLQLARGKFIVVYYEIVSDLNRRMQPSTHISDDFVLMDVRGREWGSADYEGDFFGISGDAAQDAGCDDPARWIGAGFSGCTAVVFDVPLDAGGFSVVWKDAGISITLDE